MGYHIIKKNKDLFLITMPQFDTFIFSSSLCYFIISFFLVLYLNFNQYLPRLSSLLKLRQKLIKKPLSIKTSNVSLNTSGITVSKVLSSF